MAQFIKDASELNVGDYYEDCRFRPMILLSKEGEHLWGKDLVTPEYEGRCSAIHCSVRKLTEEEAQQWKQFGPPDLYSFWKFNERDPFPSPWWSKNNKGERFHESRKNE